MIRTNSLPKYDLDFKPASLLKPVWYLPSTNRILCGERSAGKTTFLEMGMKELAKHGIYLKDDLRTFDGTFNEQTPSVSRYALQQTTKLKSVDSWIDCDGLAFSVAFLGESQGDTADKILKRVFEEVDAMILIISAQRLLDLHRMKNSRNREENKHSNAVIASYTNGLALFRGFQVNPRLSILPVRFRFSVQWHCIITQCGDIADSTEEWKELGDAIDDFSLRTGLSRLCDRVLLCDSKPFSLKRMEIPLTELAFDDSGNMSMKGAKESEICSAGLAMALVLKRLKTTDEGFIHKLRK